MDRYFTVVKSRRGAANEDKNKDKDKFHPYPRVERTTAAKRKEHINKLLTKLEESDAPPDITSLLLNTLPNESNPLTHSDLYERSDHVVSLSTGHQVADGRTASSHPDYIQLRTKKLEVQRQFSADAKNDASQILRNTRIYIDGFLADTTDIEMKRIITQAGGQVLMTPSSATHILTSQGLSGSKTHKLLTSSKKAIHVVKPEWVTDSIDAGKRLSERFYNILKSQGSGTLLSMWAEPTDHKRTR